MECNSGLELNDKVTPQRRWQLISSRRERLLSNDMGVDVPPPINFPAKGESASNSTSLGPPQLQPDEELEEVKGFMELGFQFPQDQLSPRVLSVLPGLKRFGCQRRITVPADAIELPSPKDVSVDLMKERLRLWARSVASMVKC